MRDSGLLTGCTTKQDIHSRRTSWLSISILVLSIYSTLWSGLYLGIAIMRPRYGRFIRSGGSLTPTTASILFALFAKTIELSFVTVFVTFLGQVLSRRSLIKASRGVTIAELTMRTWVIQPGFMITHWQHLQHAGLTFLGGITLIAAIVAMFYTTASDAIVSPQLKMGHWQHKVMQGLVQTSYADSYFVANHCQTPISHSMDPEYAADTCLSIEHAGQAYHNFLGFSSTWSQINLAGEGISTNIADRPQVTGMLYDNTTAIGSWVEYETSNVTKAWEQYGRVINNISMSMPHAGVFAAAQDQINGIIQPADLEGIGEYSVIAAVVSPTINILCVNMNASELAPLVYTTWPDATTTLSDIPGQELPWVGYQNEVQLLPNHTYLNSTVVDNIFEWGAAYKRQPPIFPMYPIDFNSVTNISVPKSDSIYILLKSSLTPDYTLCQLRSYLSPTCSTQYNVSGSTGGSISSNCNNPNNTLSYASSHQGRVPISRWADYRDVASEWALSLSLNTGISNANSSTSRLLSQMIIPTPSNASSSNPPSLSSEMPSISEALAALSGCTLLLSSLSASYKHYWSHPSNILDPGVYEPFNSSLASAEYTSGPLASWQGIFYLVLVLVFLTNVFCLSYFLGREGLVTDWSEPQNLFALAVNSPQSKRLEGACGAGPENEQLEIDWHVEHVEGSRHFFIKEGELGGSGASGMSGAGVEMNSGKRNWWGRQKTGLNGEETQVHEGLKMRGANTFPRSNSGTKVRESLSSYSKLSISRGGTWL